MKRFLVTYKPSGHNGGKGVAPFNVGARDEAEARRQGEILASMNLDMAHGSPQIESVKEWTPERVK